jgi:hypothetical protein
LQHFVDVCLGREEPLITPEQGFEGVQLVEAIYRSAQEGRAIELPLSLEDPTSPPAPDAELEQEALASSS